MIARRIRWRFAVVTTHPITGASQDVWKGRHSKPAWERFYAFCGLGYGTSVTLVKRRTAQDGTAIEEPMASIETTHAVPAESYEPPNRPGPVRTCGATGCQASVASIRPNAKYCSTICAREERRRRERNRRAK